MPKNATVPERWLEKVDRRGSVECWPWTASRDPDGYGRFQEPTPYGQRHIRAHVWIMRELYGEIPPGAVAMHECDHPWCVNPAHLRFGTPFENNADKVRKNRHAVPWGTPLARARQTHCKRGHPFDDENTYVSSRGHRACKTCNRIAALRRYHEKAAPGRTGEVVAGRGDQ